MSTTEHDRFMRDHQEHARDYEDVMRSSGQREAPIRSAMSDIPASALTTALFTAHKPRPGKTVYKYNTAKKAWLATK